METIYILVKQLLSEEHADITILSSDLPSLLLCARIIHV